MNAALREHLKSGKTKEDLRNRPEYRPYRFLYKISLILYTMGYLSMTKVDSDSISVVYVSRDREKYAPIVHAINAEGLVVASITLFGAGNSAGVREWYM